MLIGGATAVYGEIVCPPPADYAPCNCVEFPSDPTHIDLNCVLKNLTDLQISNILNSLLTTPGVSPLATLNLPFNELTVVPNELSFFSRSIDYVDLQGNDIGPSISNGTFNFQKVDGGYLRLFLQRNQVKNIEPGAFQGKNSTWHISFISHVNVIHILLIAGETYGNGTQIDLNNNQLTKFESSVFQSVLEKIVPFASINNAFISVFNSKL